MDVSTFAPAKGRAGKRLHGFWHSLRLPRTVPGTGEIAPFHRVECSLKVRFRRRRPGVAGSSALNEFGTLLRLVFGSAAATVAAYLDRLDPTSRTGGRSGSENAGTIFTRLRRELAAAKSQRDALIGEILRYDK